ncbi:MAG: hypothetical protein B7O98_08735 [Zestosphaera tikiterensis]|uniref:Uncharacterized protein n=2 Tax=Zestosphaera tikiterensis TaxID=1973259 RepID=A0A2R7Y2Q7_9CREN|nr:MAG: hypothetical protein B7O98_08735 [Zestosphaera tikiterensis]
MLRLIANVFNKSPASVKRYILTQAFKTLPKVIRVSRRIPLLNPFAGIIIENHTPFQLLSLSRTTRLSYVSEGMYTGRIIYINGPIPVTELGLQCSGESRERCELLYSTKIKGILNELENNIYNLNLKSPPESRFMRAFIHEYVHWMILRGTSLATLVDALSWKERLDLIYLLEKFHRFTGFPRENGGNGIGRNETFNELKKLENAVREFSKNPDHVEVFRDFLTHHLFLRGFYSSIIGIVVEPVTWVLVEPEFVNRRDEYLRIYFQDDALRKYATEILNLSEDFLNKGGNKGKLVEIAKTSLDIPLNLVDRYRLEIGLHHLPEEIKKRFELGLKGEYIETSTNEEKRLTTVLHYILYERYEVNAKVIRLLSEIIAEEPEVFDYLASRFASLVSLASQRTYENATVFTRVCWDGNCEILRYDPLAEPTLSREEGGMRGVHVKRTNREFGTLEDLVGDLPLTMRTAFEILYLLSLGEQDEVLEKGRVLMGDEFKRYCEVIKELKELISTEDPNKSVAGEILDLSSFDEYHFELFLKLWLYLVLRLGRALNKLSGLHGMFF